MERNSGAGGARQRRRRRRLLFETSTAQKHKYSRSTRQPAEGPRHAAQDPVIQQKLPCTGGVVVVVVVLLSSKIIVKQLIEIR